MNEWMMFMPLFAVKAWVVVTIIVIIALVVGLVALSIYGKKLQNRQEESKRFRGQKVPIVKAKIGNQIMSLMCDEKIFEQIPVKKSVKAKVSGIYILEVKGLRTNLETPTGKRSFRSRMQDKLTGMQAKAKAAAEKTDKK